MMTTPLELTRAEMRALGDRALEMVIHHFATRRELHTATTITQVDAVARLHTELPETPTSPEQLLDILARDVFPNSFHADHPRFYAFVPSPTNFVSAVADFLISGHNLFAGHWLASSAASQIELTVLEWLCTLCGFPAGSSGIFVSGGSMANLSAIVTAREVKMGAHDARAVIYCSDQTHSSLFKALRVLGFSREQRRVIPTDSELRLDVPALRLAIEADIAAGLRPLCVVANAGTTNTGAIDPLSDIADVCAAHDVWMHVDGAYGAAATLTPRGRELLAGIERADSITLDPHKWLFQSYELGCLLVRDPRHLVHAFHVGDDNHADYLADVARHVQENVNFYDRGIQLTRSAKAIKLWLSMRAFGLPAFRSAIESGFAQAEHAETWLRASGVWQIVTPAQMGIVTFRYAEAGLSAGQVDAATARAVDRMRLDGHALIMSTMLGDRPALRMCTIHPSGTLGDVESSLARLEQFQTEEAALERAGGTLGTRD
ncbi:MAG: aminotransferase class V-fold PLP-dependent enzyme [Gemmatimonadaceae bacterium]|nr:aminotransferase class V-fold PLP-dependent enzyme [Gemmatimonadaceae bacterium]